MTRTLVMALGLWVCGCQPPPAPAQRAGSDEGVRRQDIDGTTAPTELPARGALSARLDRFARAEPGERDGLRRELDLLEEGGTGRVLVQLRAEEPEGLSFATAEWLSTFDARPRVRGIRSLDVWVEPEELARLGAAVEGRATVRLPRRPVSTLGSAETQGVALSGADGFHDHGVTGAGVHVAVVDLAFGGWQGAESAGELAATAGAPPAGSSDAHGTACAEIVSDMAPGVVLHPVAVATNADLEAFVAGLAGSEVQVISDSLVWTEDSFSDGTGPHCELASMAREAGVAWVSSSGNRGGGAFYLGELTDSDDDGVHEFAAGDEINELSLGAGQRVRVVLDWDDYPASAQDLDLHIHREDGGSWTEVASSTIRQDGATPPWEIASYTALEADTYGISVDRVAGDRDGMRLRLFATTGLRLEHWQATGAIEDAAQCEEVVAVGAIVHGDYEAGPIWQDSGRGPTMDGRTKPDIVAPTLVETAAIGDFVGTSAAAPHVAGAIALYMEATSAGAIAASEMLLADAEPMGEPAPNDTYGRGRLVLRQARLEGSEPSDCVPAEERCNGRDDDCDGLVDELAECDADGGDPDTDAGSDTGGGGCDCAAASSSGAPPLGLVLALLLSARLLRRGVQ